jgi:ABC-type multidrug transport system ATPase subunit
MKVTLKNLGLLKQAEFTLGDLTIICGSNNMGKTYATYALFGLLHFWHEQFSSEYYGDLAHLGIDIDFDEIKLSELISNGVVTINLQEIIVNQFNLNIDSICKEYSQVELARVFAASLKKFQDSEIGIDLDISWEEFKLKFANSFIGEEEIYINETKILHISKSKNLGIKIELVGTTGVISFTKSFPKIILVESLKAFIFSILMPKPFIISSERTGVATFRKELDFARNRMLKTIAHHVSTDPDVGTITSMLQRGYQDYPLPVEQNVEFTRNLERIFKQRSFIADLHPEILDEFADMIGGDYQITGDNILSYVPNKNKKLKLSLTESSSAIRSLLDLGFYLRHQAAVGDLLMIDEPELNLHPDNQRRIARLLARLVNLGIKVFITTHSSYIIKELNTLIMLDRDEPHLKQIAAEEKYLESELLSHDKVKVYIAKEALVQLDGQKKKTRTPTLVPATISPELGIELTSFDTAINTINRIQERIVWGSD